MDIDMPVKNGFQASQEISNLYDSNLIKNYKIVAHSAFNDNDSSDRAKKSGITDFMPKPLKI